MSINGDRGLKGKPPKFKMATGWLQKKKSTGGLQQVGGEDLDRAKADKELFQFRDIAVARHVGDEQGLRMVAPPLVVLLLVLLLVLLGLTLAPGAAAPGGGAEAATGAQAAATAAPAAVVTVGVVAAAMPRPRCRRRQAEKLLAGAPDLAGRADRLAALHAPRVAEGVQARRLAGPAAGPVAGTAANAKAPRPRSLGRKRRRGGCPQRRNANRRRRLTKRRARRWGRGGAKRNKSDFQCHIKRSV